MSDPRADELLESIRWSFETFIVPELEDEYAVSVGHTITNLLRHVTLRVRLEAPALGEHVRDLRELLPTIRDHARGSGAPALAGVADDVDAALAATTATGTSVPGVVELGEQAKALRWCLDRSLRALQAAKPELGTDEEYLALRAAIRACLARHLEREDEWMAPAFSGRRR